MVVSKLRKVGNSYVVTVPREEVDRLGLSEGQTVTLEVRPAEVTVRPVLAEDLRPAFELEFRRAEAGLRYLAEH